MVQYWCMGVYFKLINFCRTQLIASSQLLCFEVCLQDIKMLPSHLVLVMVCEPQALRSLHLLPMDNQIVHEFKAQIMYLSVSVVGCGQTMGSSGVLWAQWLLSYW